MSPTQIPKYSTGYDALFKKGPPAMPDIANNPFFTNPLPAVKCAISNGKVFEVRSLVGNTHYKWEILF